MQWVDPGLNNNKPTKPLDTGPFSITCNKVKSHPRNLEGLQEPSFYSDEGKWGIQHDHTMHCLFIHCMCSFYYLTFNYHAIYLVNNINPLKIHSFIINLSAHDHNNIYQWHIPNTKHLPSLRSSTQTLNRSILTIHHMHQKHNTHKQNIKINGFNVVLPKLGYVHNEWLLILFIQNILTGVHCTYNNIYHLTWPKPT